MTNPRNPEQDDQELSQEQLKDAAGGSVYIKFDGLKEDSTDGTTVQMPYMRANKPTNAIDKSNPGYISTGGSGS